jgi:hypothetical protein
VLRFAACPPERLLEGRWRALYGRLGSGRFAVRQAASRALGASQARSARRVAVLGAASPDAEVRERCSALLARFGCPACGGSGHCPGCDGWGAPSAWPDRRFYCDRCYRDWRFVHRAGYDGPVLPTKCAECFGTGQPPA